MFPSRCCGQTHHSCLWGVEFSGVYCMCSGTDQTPARSSSTLVFHRISKAAARRPAHERGMAAPSARLSTPSTSTTTGNLPESIRFGRAPSYGEIEKHYVILHDGAVTYYYFFVMGMKGESVNHALHTPLFKPVAGYISKRLLRQQFLRHGRARQAAPAPSSPRKTYPGYRSFTHNR